jgi:hypothetical protein
VTILLALFYASGAQAAVDARIAREPEAAESRFAGIDKDGEFLFRSNPAADVRPLFKDFPLNGSYEVQPVNLLWHADASFNYYEYCIDITNNNNCDSNWEYTSTSTGVLVSSLTVETIYYWQVRGVIQILGNYYYFYADDNSWWRFTTVPPEPGAFGKTAPADGAVVSVNPTISWEASSDAAGYQY